MWRVECGVGEGGGCVEGEIDRGLTEDGGNVEERAEGRRALLYGVR